MALTEIPIELSSTPSIVDGGNATALTIDSSENVTFAGNILHAGALTLDVGGNIILDADGAEIIFKDGGTQFGEIYKSGNDLRLESNISNGNLVFSGNDGGTGVVALTLDMSEKGAATFTAPVFISHTGGDALTLTKGTTEPSLRIEGDSNKDFVITISGELLTITKNDGTTDIITFDHDTGHVLMPLQPAFSAVIGSGQSNIAINTETTIAFNAEIFDTGANYNNSNYIFTAPVTGKYQLNTVAYMVNVDSAADYVQLSLKTSNRQYYSIIDPGTFSGDADYWYLNVCVLADMDASDTAFVEIQLNNSGAAQMDLTAQTYFNGYLVA
mgnify:FL=1